MALIGLYSGAYILKHKDERGFKLGRSRQTAKSAYNGIVKKYGTVKPGSKYRHVGKGVWRIYSISNDRKRTGKTTADKKKWAKQPHKLDFKGIDTKGSKVKKTVATKGKEPTGISKQFIIKKDVKTIALDKAVEEYEFHLATLTRWPYRKLDREYVIQKISDVLRDYITPTPEVRTEFRKRGKIFKDWVKLRDQYAKEALSDAIKRTPKSAFNFEKWKAKQKR